VTADGDGVGPTGGDCRTRTRVVGRARTQQCTLRGLGSQGGSDAAQHGTRGDASVSRGRSRRDRGGRGRLVPPTVRPRHTGNRSCSRRSPPLRGDGDALGRCHGWAGDPGGSERLWHGGRDGRTDAGVLHAWAGHRNRAPGGGCRNLGRAARCLLTLCRLNQHRLSRYRLTLGRLTHYRLTLGRPTRRGLALDRRRSIPRSGRRGGGGRGGGRRRRWYDGPRWQKRGRIDVAVRC
jgi:hypothetical protein